MKRYRELKGSELLSLKGKWLMNKLNNKLLLPVEGIEIIGVSGAIKLDGNWYTPFSLLKEQVHEDGTPVGIEIELSYDNLTLEEFMTKANNDCSNVEYYHSKKDKWEITVCDVNMLRATTANELSTYRIKPTPRYIRPKVGFRGSVMCEVRCLDIRTEDSWTIKEVIAVLDTKNYFNYLAVDSGDENIYSECRLLPFSADNPPPVGTRFRDSNRDVRRYLALHRENVGLDTDCHSIIPEYGKKIPWKNIEWIDFEEVVDE